MTVTSVTVTPGDRQLTVEWDAPAGADGLTDATTVEYYEVFYTDVANPAEDDWNSAGTVNPPATRQVVISGLNNGVTYQIAVDVTTDESVVHNSSTFSATPTAAADTTAPTVSFSPADGAVTGTAGTNITVTFNEAVRNASDDSAITNTNAHAVVTLKKGNTGADLAVGNRVSVNPGKTVITINPASALTDGSYTVAVTGVEDAAGNALTGTSSATFTVDTARPAVPGNFLATPGDGSVTLTWNSPSPADASIEKWQYQQKIGTASYGSWTDIAGGASITSYTVPSLANGTVHTFKLRAADAVGPGTASPEASATPTVAATVPAKPAAPTLVPGNQQLSVSWTAPATGGSPIIDYDVQYRQGVAGSWTEWDSSATSTATSAVITGLTNNQPYQVQVRATNSVGDSPWSNTASGTPAAADTTAPTVSFSPADGAVTGNANTNITVTFTEAVRNASDDSAIDNANAHAVVTLKKGNTGADLAAANRVSVNPAKKVITIDPLNALSDGSYTVAVTGVEDAAGNALTGTSSATFTVDTARPLAPGNFRAAAGDGSVTLTWNNPNDASIVKWQYQQKTGGGSYGSWTDIVGGASITSYTVSSLANGTVHAFKLRAADAVGPGTESAEKTATPTVAATAPAKPAAPTLTPGNRQLSVSWSAPATGGSPITDYDVRYRAGTAGPWTEWAASATSTATSAVITGLTNNQPYQVQVRATNSVGDSPWSNAASGTPEAVTVAAPSVTATPGDGRLTVRWSVPAVSGGMVGRSISYEVSLYRTRDEYKERSHTMTTTSFTFNGLTNDETYRVEVVAIYYVSSTWAELARSPKASVESTPGAGMPAPTVSFSPADGALTQNANTNVTVTFSEKVRNASDDSAITNTNAHAVVTLRKDGTGSDLAVSGRVTVNASIFINPTIITIDPLNALADGSYTVAVTGVEDAAGHALTGASSATFTVDTARPAVPANFRAAAGAGSVTLSWNSPSPADASIEKWQYQQKIGTGNYGSWTDIGGSGAGTASHTVAGLAAGTVHAFKLRAADGVGPGTESAQASATPTPAVAQGTVSTLTVYERSLKTAGKVGLRCAYSTPPAVRWARLRLLRDGARIAEVSHTPATAGTPSSYNFVDNQDRTARGATYLYTCELHTSAASAGRPPPDGSFTKADERSLRVTVPGDTTAPKVSFSPLDSTVTSYAATTIVLTFSEAVRNADGSALTDANAHAVVTLRKDGAGPDLAAANRVSVNPAKTVITINPLNALSDGEYTVAVTGVEDAAGNALAGASSATFKVDAARPAAPADFRATPGDGSVTLSWTDPNDPSIVKWQVRRKTGAGGYGSWTDISGSDAGTVSHTVTGLANGVTHAFKLRAVGWLDSGRESPQASATPTAAATAPARPAAPTLTPGNGQLSVSWTAPATGGSPIADYDVRYRLGASGVWTEWEASTTSTATRATVTGLTNAQAYLVQVRATNSVGDSPWSNAASGTPAATAPARPAAPALTPGNGQLSVSWSAPATGGSPITGYGIEYRAGTSGPWTSHAHGGTATRTTIPDLTNNRAYRVRVRAANAVGRSPWSPVAGAAPSTVTAPAAPSALTLAPGDGRLAVSWDVPANGGLAIGSYRVAVYTGAGRLWRTYPVDGAVTRIVVTGLTNGQAYRVQVRAWNRRGWGPWSASVSAIPSAAPPAGWVVPSVPTGLAAVAGNGEAALAWSASARGSGDVGYDLRWRTRGRGGWTIVRSGAITGTGHTVTGLTNGTGYEFQARASNRDGSGVWHVSAWTASAVATPDVVAVAEAPGKAGTPVPVAGDREVALTWTAPASAGGTPIVGYEVRYRSGGAAWTTDWARSTATARTVGGLTNGQSYVFQVRAVNDSLLNRGRGPWSDAATATPAWVAPSAPTELAAAPGDEEAVLSWTASSRGSGDVGYDVRYRMHGPGSWTLVRSGAISGIAHTVSGLANGTEYEFQARASNRDTSGVWHVSAWTGSVVATPAAPPSAWTAPSAPTELAAAPGDGEAALTWTASAQGSGDVGYDLRWRTRGTGGWTFIPSEAITGTGHTVTGLTDGTEYEFQARASNRDTSGVWHVSTWTASVVATPTVPASAWTAPSVPTELAAAPGDGEAALTWTASAQGSGDVGYDLRWRTRGSGGWTFIPSEAITGTGHTVTGLTDGTEYEFQARASNLDPSGMWHVSAWTASVLATPAAAAPPSAWTAPSVPTELAAAPGAGEAALAWTASAQGSGDVGYDLRWRTRGSGGWTFIPSGAITGTGHTITGLTDGTEYEFQARASNQDDTGAWHVSDWTGSAIATPATAGPPSAWVAPSAPTGLAAMAHNRAMVLTWERSGAGSGTVGYDVEYKLATPVRVWYRHGSGAVGDAARFRVPGLLNGVRYLFRVRAVNRSPDGAWHASAWTRAVVAAPAPQRTVSTGGTAFERTYVVGGETVTVTAGAGVPAGAMLTLAGGSGGVPDAVRLTAGGAARPGGRFGVRAGGSVGSVVDIEVSPAGARLARLCLPAPAGAALVRYDTAAASWTALGAPDAGRARVCAGPVSGFPPLAAARSARSAGAPPALSVADARAVEGAGARLGFRVTLAGAAGAPVTVDYATADGTAKAGEDYTALSGTLSFAAGETEKTVSVAVLDDAHDEGEERMTLALSNPAGRCSPTPRRWGSSSTPTRCRRRGSRASGAPRRTRWWTRSRRGSPRRARRAGRRRLPGTRWRRGRPGAAPTPPRRRSAPETARPWRRCGTGWPGAGRTVAPTRSAARAWSRSRSPPARSWPGRRSR